MPSLAKNSSTFAALVFWTVFFCSSILTTSHFLPLVFPLIALALFLWCQRSALLNLFGALVLGGIFVTVGLTVDQHYRNPSRLGLPCEPIERLETRCFDPDLRIYRQSYLPLSGGPLVTEVFSPAVETTRLVGFRLLPQLGDRYEGPYLTRSEALALLRDQEKHLQSLSEMELLHSLNARFSWPPSETAPRLCTQLTRPLIELEREPGVGVRVIDLPTYDHVGAPYRTSGRSLFWCSALSTASGSCSTMVSSTRAAPSG